MKLDIDDIKAKVHLKRAEAALETLRENDHEAYLALLADHTKAERP